MMFRKRELHNVKLQTVNGQLVFSYLFIKAEPRGVKQVSH